MSRIYATAHDFIDQELTQLGEASEGFDSRELWDRCRDAGLITYDDGYDLEIRGYVLNRAGFRWAEGVDDPESPGWAKLWGLIEEIDQAPGA